uniref:Ubiquitin-like modifier-activating enzyme ATG7 n=1 Tax=Blastobotrys adeninivorans TaxID=409370 RepID=A0A060T8J7_BLAAD
MSSKLQFAPFRSFVDAGFFTELSDRKLNTLKLSEEELAISATYTTPVGGDAWPTISVSGDSFTDTVVKASPALLQSPGSITNLNTVESFKKLDKQQFLRQHGQAILSAINDRSALEDPSVLTKFTIAAFSDLKKYKFYYWFAFPAIQGVSLSVNEVSAVPKAEAKELSLAVDSWRQGASANQWGFFLLRKVNDEDWQAASLSECADWKGEVIVGFSDPSTISGVPGWPLRNFIALLAALGCERVQILCLRDHLNLIDKYPAEQERGRSLWISVTIDQTNTQWKDQPSFVGWERNSNEKLAPKVSDLGSLINPNQLADQAVDLNLRLMKWRIAPSIDLDVVQQTKCLILGAGTLGSYVGRGLLGWGVRKVTFVDSGRVSFSNPVRQPLYTFKDCLEGGAPKAKRAAESLKEIYPSVDAQGYELSIPMLGHGVTNPTTDKEDYDKLVQLIDEHDVVFLLLDSRESRWLPTVISAAKKKLVINVALGFDSYVVMRHGINSTSSTGTPQPKLGCYYCNDVVAPMDSISNQTLDQMCTVTRPGVAMLASSLAIELLVSVLQHPLQGLAPAPDQEGDNATAEDHNPLGEVPHQLRGFLHNFSTVKVWGPGFSACSACSAAIVDSWTESGWDFVKRALAEPSFVEELSGLAEVQRQADAFDSEALSLSDFSDS